VPAHHSLHQTVTAPFVHTGTNNILRLTLFGPHTHGLLFPRLRLCFGTSHAADLCCVTPPLTACTDAIEQYRFPQAITNANQIIKRGSKGGGDQVLVLTAKVRMTSL